MPHDGAPNQEYFLTNPHGDRYLYSVNHNTLNRFGAAATHRQRFDQLTAAEDTLFIVAGSDSGTLVSYLADKEIGAGTQFILIEPPDLFDLISSQLELPAHPQIHFIAASQLDETLQQCHFNVYAYLDQIHTVESLGVHYAFHPAYHDFFFALQERLHSLTWSIQASLGLQPFIDAQLANIADNMATAAVLKGAFAGQTAVLLAGGPSLDDLLPWVASHRDRLVVLAVSRVSRRLLEVNLRPDIIFSIDPHPVSFDVSKEMLRFGGQCLFVNHVHVSPQLLGQWIGHSLFIGDRYPWETPLNPPSLETAGPTVANTALAAAVRMGFHQVVLAGVDLCHDRDGFTHAKGSNERQAGPQLGKRCTQVQTNGGWLAETSSDFATAIQILAQQAATARENNVTLINPASGAAKVDGVQHLLADRISLPSSSRPAREILQGLLPNPSREDRQRDLERVREEVVRVIGQLHAIHKLANEALRCNEALFGRRGRKQDFKHKKRMDRIEHLLNSRHREVALFAKQYGIRAFLGISRVRGAKDWSDTEMEDKARLYYEAYRDTSRQLIDLLGRTKRRLESRLHEFSPQPDLDRLCDRWIKDGQPGRALVWLNRRGLALTDLTQPQQEPLKRCLDGYDRLMAETETEHYRRSRQFARLDSQLRGKIQMYFQKKDAEALNRISHSLAQHGEPDQATRYCQLCAAYLAELADEPAQALEWYQQLFEQDDELLIEDALQRVATLSLTARDIDNGLLALKTLASISPAAYLQKYGDLLWMTGDRQAAISAYLDYLEQQPMDWTAMLKLAGYYRTMGLDDGARTLYAHVLKLDPDNPSAKLQLDQL